MDKNFEFPSLTFYTELAKKTISKFGNKMYGSLSSEMLSNEDAISDVANALMTADWKYDKERVGSVTGQSKTRYSYRNQCAIWAIKTYATKSKKKKNYFLPLSVLESKNEDCNTDSFLCDEKLLTPLDDLINRETEDLNSELVSLIFTSGILSDKQAQQIKMYYIDQLTLNDIGRHFNVTREAVRQNIKNGIAKLKQNLVI